METKIMKNNVTEFSKSEAVRDSIFKFTTDFLDNKPLNIGEVGCARSEIGRATDGWSTFFWADYVYKNGGSLKVCDIEKEAINFVNETIPEKYKVESFYMSGTDFLKEKQPFDFIYLDGSNDPDETRKQFYLIEETTRVILVDDWDTKGFIRSQEQQEEFEEAGFIFCNMQHAYGCMGLIIRQSDKDRMEELINKIENEGD